MFKLFNNICGGGRKVFLEYLHLLASEVSSRLFRPESKAKKGARQLAVQPEDFIKLVSKLVFLMLLILMEMHGGQMNRQQVNIISPVKKLATRTVAV